MRPPYRVIACFDLDNESQLAMTVDCDHNLRIGYAVSSAQDGLCATECCEGAATVSTSSGSLEQFFRKPNREECLIEASGNSCRLFWEPSGRGRETRDTMAVVWNGSYDVVCMQASIANIASALVDATGDSQLVLMNNAAMLVITREADGSLRKMLRTMHPATGELCCRERCDAGTIEINSVSHALSLLDANGDRLFIALSPAVQSVAQWLGVEPTLEAYDPTGLAEEVANG